MKQQFRAIVATSVLVMIMIPTVLAATSTVNVTDNDVGDTWFEADTRAGGDVEFVVGPSSPPLGTGSLEMSSDSAIGGSSQAKAQLVTPVHAGTQLADIDTFAYWDYRESSSTNPSVQRISLNVVVDFNGSETSGGFTTLVFEPVYNLDQQPLLLDTWQEWDAFNSGNAIWWSTKELPGGICAFNCFVTWDTIVENNPAAEIFDESGYLGFNIGSGWIGQFTGAGDALAFGSSGDTTIYNFESLIGPPTSKDECKDGGWQDFNNPTFKNQGDCVSYVVSNRQN